MKELAESESGLVSPLLVPAVQSEGAYVLQGL